MQIYFKIEKNCSCLQFPCLFSVLIWKNFPSWIHADPDVPQPCRRGWGISTFHNPVSLNLSPTYCLAVMSREGKVLPASDPRSLLNPLDTANQCFGSKSFFGSGSWILSQFWSGSWGIWSTLKKKNYKIVLKKEKTSYNFFIIRKSKGPITFYNKFFCQSSLWIVNCCIEFYIFCL